MVDPLGDFHGISTCLSRLAACHIAVSALLRTLCRVPSDARVHADVIAPCPPTDGAAGLLTDTDSISHSAKKETDRSPFSIRPVEFRRDRCTPVPGAGIEPAASTFRAWRHYQQQLPRSRRFGKEDSNLHHLIQSQGAFRLADSRERPAGVEPACRNWKPVPGRSAQDAVIISMRYRGFEPRSPGWKPGVVPLDQSRHAAHARAAEGEGVEPPRLIARPSSSRVPSPVGLPFRDRESFMPELVTRSFQHRREESNLQSSP